MSKRHTTAVIVLFACLLLLPTIDAQSPNQPSGRPTDVSGWHGARWGMSEDEVKSVIAGRWRAATKEEREDDRDAYVPFVLQDVSVGGRNFIGLFGFARTDRRLIGVTLHSGLPLFGPEEATTIFERMADLLIRELGPPAKIIKNNSGHTGFYVDVAIWRFPSSVISLQCVKPNDAQRAVVLSYTSSSGKSVTDRP